MTNTIAIRNESGGLPGYKEFNILGGIATVYRQRISLDQSLGLNINWFKNTDEFYYKPIILNYDHEFSNSISKYSFKTVDYEAMYSEVERSLIMANKYIMPYLTKVVDLESCIEFITKFIGWQSIYGPDENFFNDHPMNFYNEGLLYVKTGYSGDFMERLESREAYESARRHVPGAFENYDDYYRKYCDYALIERNKLDRLLSNTRLYENCISELNRRREANTEILRSYGLDI